MRQEIAGTTAAAGGKGSKSTRAGSGSACKILRRPKIIASTEFQTRFSGLCRRKEISPEGRSCPMRPMKLSSISDDQIDAILPVAGAVAALIVLLVILAV